MQRATRGIRRFPKTRTALTVAVSALLSTPVMADDLDVYTAMIDSAAKPNVLFVLDYSGSMAWEVDGTTKSRLDVLQEAMGQILDENYNSINAGLGSLFEYESTGIKWPISELSADASTIDGDIPAGMYTVRDIINLRLTEKGANGSTATVDALVEAAQYFRGDSVTHNDSPDTPLQRHRPARWDQTIGGYVGGDRKAAHFASYSPQDAFNETGGTAGLAWEYCYDYSASGGNNYCDGRTTRDCTTHTGGGTSESGDGPSTYDRCTYDSTVSWSRPRYVSPISSSCQANAIVLISDGNPTSINDGASLQSVAGTDLSGCADQSYRFSDYTFSASETSLAGNCGPEIAAELANNDQIPSISGSTVQTYTVGFAIGNGGQEYLDELALQGNGESFRANNPEELNDALKDILGEIVGDSESFSAMAVNVDRESFSHDNRVFLNMFSPSGRKAWQGNLKGYFIDSSGLVDIHGNAATSIVDGDLKFAPGTQSFWSAAADGNKLELGGASESMVDGGRNLYTFIGTTSGISGEPLAGVASRSLTSGNSTITAAHLGLATGDPVREQALDWLQTAPMGDALHSRPAIVDYAGRTVVFTMTNQGLLHAIDATDPSEPNGNSAGGEELFAFMPQELLANLPDVYLKASGDEHIYGLDGQITPWHEDANGNGIVDGSDTLLLVFGMRRGGGNYYALDVTNPLAPRMKWTLSSDMLNLDRMGETWSRMSLIPVKLNGSLTRVLAFGGGYDAAALDDQSSRVTSKGNGIYMVNQQGQLVWHVDSARSSKLAYAIPSDLTIIDSDQDGASDRIYVGDMGGQVLRVDFDDINDLGSGATVNVLADLSDASQNQRFFYPPSVSIESHGGKTFLAVAIGSGDRSDPLNVGSSNRIYMIRDTWINEPLPASFTSFTSADLYDASANHVQSSDSAVAALARTDLINSKGWFINLAPGEKALSSLVSFEGKIMATTFQPDSSATIGSCTISNLGRLYVMSTSDAAPAAFDSDGNQDHTLTDPSDRITTLSGSGIPSEPVIMFPSGSSQVQIMVDKDSVSLLNQKITRVYWHAK